MRCPACQSPLTETDAACRQCGFTLEAADRALGIPPFLEKPIIDPENHLTFLARRRLQRRAAVFVRKFPQVSIAIVLMEVPPQVTPALYAFWLFNRAQLSSGIETGGDNHCVLLFIDPSTSRSIAMVGYGLEPFFAQNQLQLCLNVFGQSMRRQGLVDGIEAFIAELDAQFLQIYQQLPSTFGIADKDHWHDTTEAPDAHGFVNAPETVSDDEY